MEQQNQAAGNDDSVSVQNKESKQISFGQFDEEANSRKGLEGRFQMHRFDSTVSTGKIKRTFSKDLFMVDRGRLRARHDER